uniref:Uncharacterized mitochondrial protein AtMg00810-like n=1 Tax=Nicotiana tabacum TaxID=4097 RepID=A0A1S4B1Z1_TOBAC
MGLLHYFLGLEVHQVEDGIFISQKKYGRDLLNKFGMLNCKPTATPMNINEKLHQEDREEFTDARLFRSLVGVLIYLTHTKPYIAFSVGVIFRFMQQPSKIHYGAAKRVLRYIVETLDFGSGVVTWSSKKQATTTFSTSEAEYIAANSAACQAKIFRDLGYNTIGPVGPVFHQ